MKTLQWWLLADPGPLDENMTVIRVVPRCPVAVPSQSHLVAILAVFTDCFTAKTATSNQDVQWLYLHNRTSLQSLLRSLIVSRQRLRLQIKMSSGCTFTITPRCNLCCVH
ncbi:hypothetical protein PoB_003042200 [Plakobranchus ocellatus]|uniref:Uncharacterized protein n=1 Tax=Plakobranchus ocellatus TaxID=259542 RepID=A0AAV4AAB0_9GAST|nr:hypothetical protein PoB_003042200 [Plakobranchus ocellatus]